MRRQALLRALTLGLAFVHTFPARKHLVALVHEPSLSESWKGVGALFAVGFYLLPLRVHVWALRTLWHERRGLLRAGGIILAIVHAVPASDHVPRFVASGQWADAWRGFGSGLALVWFLTPLPVQARIIASLARAARLARVWPRALAAGRENRSWT
jgi:hypothetical protein